MVHSTTQMTKPRSEEAYIKQRYERWRNMAVPFAYKQTKSERIAQIFTESGGLPARALELGVGPGGIAAPLSRRGFPVFGVDLSADALGRAREHCRNDRVHLLRGSGFSLPFADGTFPVVYASQVLHLFNAEHRLALMREIKRILEPGGRFVFDMKNVLTHPVRYMTSSDSRKRRNFPSSDEIDRLMNEAGYASVQIFPGVMPGLGAVQVPNHRVFQALAHTRFFVGRTPGRL